MTNAHSFPLLRLPDLAREHVVLVMDVREQYLFSTLSKKSKILTKNGSRHISYVYEWKLYPAATYLSIKKDWSSKCLTIIIASIEIVDDLSDFSCIVSKVEDFREQSIELLSFLGEIFKSSSFELECGTVPNEFVRQFVATVKNLKITVHKLWIDGDGEDNQMYEWIMQNCRDVRRLRNCCETSRDFELDSQLPFTSECCYLRYSPFLRIDHLTRLFWSCRSFRADDDKHSFTIANLNQLLKMWMRGDSKLEYLGISVDSFINIQEVMADIEKVPVESAYLQNILHHFKPGSGFKIRQHNGKEAVVCLLHDEQFIITTHFDEKDCDLFPVYAWAWSSDEETDDEEEEEGEAGDSSDEESDDVEDDGE